VSAVARRRCWRLSAMVTAACLLGLSGAGALAGSVSAARWAISHAIPPHVSAPAYHLVLARIRLDAVARSGSPKLGGGIAW